MITYKAYKAFHKKNYLYIARLLQIVKDNPKQVRQEGLSRYIDKARQAEKNILLQYPKYR